MPLTITEETNKAYFNYGDTNYPVFTMSGSLAGAPYWESPYGTFSSKNGLTTTFYPYNRSVTTSVLARMVYGTYGQFDYNNVAEDGLGKLTKFGGTNTWDAGVVLLAPAFQTGIYDGFFEVFIEDNTTEKALIFSSNGISSDPLNPSNDFSWHFMSNGQAIGRKASIPVIEVSYETGDSFRLQRVGSVMQFKVNDFIVAQAPTTPSVNLLSFMGFKTVGATLGKSFFYKTSIEPTVSYAFKINGTFPVQPNYAYEFNLDNKTIVSTAEDGTSVYRVKGMPKRNWSLNFNDRPFTEYQELYNFWTHHQKHIKFYYNDVVLNQMRYVTFDSGLRVQAAGPDRITMTCVLKEV